MIRLVGAQGVGSGKTLVCEGALGASHHILVQHVPKVLGVAKARAIIKHPGRKTSHAKRAKLERKGRANVPADVAWGELPIRECSWPSRPLPGLCTSMRVRHKAT